MPPPDPSLTVEVAVQRLQGMGEAERARALGVLQDRYPDLYGGVMEALGGTTVHRPPPPPAFSPGDLIGGKFEVVETLGEGASGSVFRALDTGHVGDHEFMSREVALKVSRVDTGHDGLNRDLLQKEARLLRRLRHPRLPVVEALFEDRGRWVLVMEYIAGDSLQARRRARAEPFDAATVLPWLRDTLRVLDYLHTLHARPATAGGGAPVTDTPIYHRDIKPANLILDAHDNLYVVDLGIARSGITELTSVVPSAVGAGSPGYAAPEVDRGEDTLPQSDLYSVGMTAFSLLTRHDAREFSARRRSDALHSGGADPLHVALDASGLPASLREWIRTTTALAPGQRFATAVEMIAALDLPLRGPAAPIGSPSRPPSPKALGWGLAGTVAAVAVAVGAWAVWPSAPPSEEGGSQGGAPVAEAGAPTDADVAPVAPAEPLPVALPRRQDAPPPAPSPVPPASMPAASPERPPAPAPAPSGRLRAVVLGEDGAPLAGARVRVVGTAAAGTTDAVGDVALADLPPGVQMVEVQAEGYVARQFRFEIAPGGTVSRTLQFEVEDLALDAY